MKAQVMLVDRESQQFRFRRLAQVLNRIPGIRRCVRVLRLIIFYGVFRPIQYVYELVILPFGLVPMHRGYRTDARLFKSLTYRGYSVRVRINSFWDYERLSSVELYPVDEILADIETWPSSEIVYYEVGANVGYTPLLISHILGNRGRVIAFEVDPINFKTFTDNILINRFKNIVPIQLGIASQYSIQKFYYFTGLGMPDGLPPSGMGMHSITFESPYHDPEIYGNFAFAPLDEVIGTFGLPMPTHIFIDAFGSEAEILKGMTATLAEPRLRKVMVQIDNVKHADDSLVARELQANGFDLTVVETMLVHQTMMSHNCVFAR